MARRATTTCTVLVSGLCGVFAVVACSGTPEHPEYEDPSEDGGRYHMDAVPPPDVVEDTAGQCNSLVLATPKVEVMRVGPTGAPAPAGGAIADGVYVLVSYKLYSHGPNGELGPTGATFNEALRIKGSVVDYLKVDEGSKHELIRTRMSGTWAITPASKFGIDLTCPTGSKGEYPYVAVNGAIGLFYPGPAGETAVGTYVLRQQGPDGPR